jgi:hypothetical protein
LRFLSWKSTALVLLTLLLVGGSSMAQTEPPESPRDEMILRMVQLARAGRIAESREVLQTYLKENPTDGTMHYNLACLDLLLQEKDQALEDLERALANGYTNFRLIQVDHDLRLLRDDPRLSELVGRYQDEFIQDFQAKALDLEEGYRSDILSLQQSNPNEVESRIPQPEISVEFNSQAMLVNISVQEQIPVGAAPVWSGGPGVLVNLIQPISPDDYEARRYYSYGFYLEDGAPQAALVGQHGQVLLRPVPRLAPRITRSGDTTQYEITIPWADFSPYAPPLDQEMGLNVFYFGAGANNSRPIFSLMPEKRASFENNPWRRYIPVAFLTSDRSSPVMRGRLYERMIESDELGVELAVWSDSEGSAQGRFSIHPKDEPGKTIGTPVTEIFPCEKEVNFFNHSQIVEDLPAGSYQLRVEFTGPDKLTFEESYSFDNFEQGWISSLNERVHEIQTVEQSTLKYHLFNLTRRVETRHPQSDASAFHQSYTEMVRMVELCEAGSSCLPDQGLFRGGFTSDVMTQRFCALYLPRGFKEMAQPHLLVTLPPTPGSEDDWAQKLGSALEGKSEVVVVVPQSHGYTGLAVAKAADQTAQAIEWAQALFNAKAVTLVGLGTGSDAALTTSLDRPELFREVLLDGDQLYRDLQEFSPSAVGETLTSRVNQCPYSLTSGVPGSPRLPIVESTMKQMGFKVTILPIKSDSPDASWLASWFLSRQ